MCQWSWPDVKTRSLGAPQTRDRSAVGAPAFVRRPWREDEVSLLVAGGPKGYAATGRYSWMSPPSTSWRSTSKPARPLGAEPPAGTPRSMPR
jgi:hypothetical protein